VSPVTSSSASKLVVASDSVGQIIVLTLDGVLDATTYLSLRDNIIKAALDDPRAVVVDVSELLVPRESALAVFTSARWHVERWPEVPILLACDRGSGRDSLARNGITRYVPVYPSVESACRASAFAGSRLGRQRVRIDLPAQATSLRRSREFVDEWLRAWSMPDWIPVSKIIVTTFVENVLAHTNGDPRVRLETDGETVMVAVQDCSHSQANVSEWSHATGRPSGLNILNALCRMWGNSPTPTGKTVWAVIGPENRL
jgi:hypothetical protein